jgi:3-(3-hydroxy-phenyl)propionate hydroxylase
MGELLQGAGERDAALPADSPAQVMRSIQPRLGTGLHAGLAEPAGRLAAQPRLSDGRLLDDEVGLRFALLLDREMLEGMRASDIEILRLNDVVILPDEASAYRQDLNTRAVLIRPDRYILGCANSLDDLTGLLARMPLGEPDAAGGLGDVRKDRNRSHQEREAR